MSQYHPAHNSVSAQVAARFARRRIWRRLVAVVYIAVTLVYLYWRATIINPDSLILSLIYFAAECMGFVLGLTIIYSSWQYQHRIPPPVADGLTVDVLVLAYLEPNTMIRRTLMAARAITYPHRTWLLDDGNQAERRELAKTLGVEYLARGKNIHAKAGNLNFGLAHSQADFVAVFDADHIAQPHALHALLGFFNDPRVALVQTPQDYYNVDAFQYMNPRRRSGLWHDQSFFYNLAQPCHDGDNASSCVGTGVVYRRSALNSVGGIPVDTLTEDIHTSLKLHKAGWQTVFLNEPVAYGVAAADLGEYYKTRHRWAHGNLHALRLENVFFAQQLTGQQRMGYASLGLVYLEGWQQLILFIVPIVSLVFGLAPFTITIFNVLMVLFFPLLAWLLLQELGCGYSRYWTNEIFAMARWPVHIVSTLGLFGRRMMWKTSSKHLHGRLNWRLLLPQLTVLGVSLSAVVIALWRLTQDYQIGPLGEAVLAVVAPQQTSVQIGDVDINAVMPSGYSIDLVAVASFWALYNVVRVLWFVAKAVHNARLSHDCYRFKVALPLCLSGTAANAKDQRTAQSRNQQLWCVSEKIAEDWVRLRLPHPLAGMNLPNPLPVSLCLPKSVLNLTLNITARGADWVEGQWQWQDLQQQDQLAAFLYSVNWYRELRGNTGYFLTPSDFILSLFGYNPDKPVPHLWQPLLAMPTHPDQAPLPYLAGFADVHSSPATRHGVAGLLSFIAPDPLAGVTWLTPQNGALVPVRLRVGTEQTVSTLSAFGLDGSVYARYNVTHSNIALTGG